MNIKSQAAKPLVPIRTVGLILRRHVLRGRNRS